MKCWGANDFGQLGQGDTDSRGDDAGEMGDDLDADRPRCGSHRRRDHCRWVHTCALLDDGTVKCWGDSVFGQLGHGDTDGRGDGAGEMGDDLDPVDLGAGRTAVAITAGDVHTCALLDNGTVKCWGSTSTGQLGYGDTDARGDGAGEMGDFLGPVSLGAGRTATAIAAGDFHTCALLDNGTVKCWGTTPSDSSATATRTTAATAPARWATTSTRSTSVPVARPIAITAGDHHTCALLDNDTVKCWGWNDFGQLGYGDTDRPRRRCRRDGRQLGIRVGAQLVGGGPGRRRTCSTRRRGGRCGTRTRGVDVVGTR